MAVSNINPGVHDRFVGVNKVTVTILNGGANGETDLEINGVIKQAIFNVPVLTGATAELLLVNEDDHNLYISGERAESTVHTLTFDRAFAGNLTVRAEANAAQSGSDATITVTLYYV